MGRDLHARNGREARRAGERGFTLLELLVVLAILGMLAAFAAPQVLNYLGGARTDAARIQIQNLSSVLDLYRLDVGQYPPQQEGLEALVDAPDGADGWRGPYLKRRDALVDPWGRPYQYANPGRSGAYDIYSLGADNAEGGSGEDEDVTNW
ncbi:type II secretion system major pseudopilin GspG [Arenibaculum sp.]|jgi:general secretion pathway protein G|uniref:type II secretion system major pseudopilin GspG n=1 Tax=Arenibaculum sp. TaxID=2865862 RepID=UPI002E10BC9D|nr:type II secretion system major pseudopilin GspG [Arenibaculum sp.]